ncbi:MAG: diguanylate cyclase, partial [Candidatus Aminicenantes bacterium]|nr:diguanylate cyclase [Candidatus Aminicenantes bacterium]
MGKILIVSLNPEERSFLFGLARKQGLIYTAATIEKAAALLSTIAFDVAVLDAESAGHQRLRVGLSKIPSLVLAGGDEDKLKEAIRAWPDDRYIDYLLLSPKPLDVARSRRVLATADAFSRLKASVSRLSSSRDLAVRKLERVYAEIKDVGGSLSQGIVREIEKRTSIQARYARFMALKRNIEDILRKIHAANDVFDLLNSLVEVKGTVQAGSVSIYILETSETLGPYLKPLVWDDDYLVHAEFSRHIALLQAEDFAAVAARSGAVVRSVDPGRDSRCAFRYRDGLRRPLRSLLAIPLQSEAGVVGVLEVYDRADDGPGGGGFTEEDEQLLRGLSEHIALAMTKLNLIQYDALTGLLRPDPFFEKIIHRLESYSKRRRESGSFAMVMGDVDWFKHYNDRHGQEAGNRLLRELAGVLRSAIREDDLLCRYGGEEFLFFLSSVGNIEEATLLTERIRKSVEEHPFPDEESQPRHDLTMSFGLTLFPSENLGPPGTVTKALLKTIASEADLALAEAKGKRMSALHVDEKLITKNRVCAFVREKAAVMSKTSILEEAKEKVFAEKRRSPRHYASTICLFRENGSYKVGCTIDLSLEGTRFSSDTPFDPAETIDLFLILGNQARAFQGEVVHSRKASAKASRYDTGVRFRDLKPADRDALRAYFL